MYEALKRFIAELHTCHVVPAEQEDVDGKKPAEFFPHDAEALASMRRTPSMPHSRMHRTARPLRSWSVRLPYGHSLRE